MLWVNAWPIKVSEVGAGHRFSLVLGTATGEIIFRVDRTQGISYETLQDSVLFQDISKYIQN